MPDPVNAEEEIIVVFGLPRSGTSLMMQMLAAGSVPLLRDLQPAHRYRVILMRRRLAEAVASQRAMLCASAVTAHACPMRRWPTCWSQLNSVAGWVRTQANFHLLEVEYHDCIANPLSVASRISSFLYNYPPTEPMAPPSTHPFTAENSCLASRVLN